MKELDNELGFFNEVEDMPDFETEALAERTETPEVEEDTSEAPENAEKPSQEEEKAELTPQEKFFWERLEEMASEDEYLAEAMKKSDKSIRECFKYMEMLAKKKLTAQTGMQCVPVEGTEMLGWAKHYYIEPKEVIDAELAPKSAKKAPSKETMKKINANPLLTSLMNKKGFAPTEDGAVEKTTTMKGGTTKTIKVEDKAKTITLKGKAGTITITEPSLF